MTAYPLAEWGAARAAGAAARAAEHSWQSDRLWQYLHGEARQ